MSVNTSTVEINSSGLHTSSYPDGSYAFSVEDAMRSRTAPPPPLSSSLSGGFSKFPAEGVADGVAISARTAASEITERDAEGEKERVEQQLRYRPSLQLLRGSDISCEPYHNEQPRDIYAIQRRAPPTPVERNGNNITSSLGRESTPARHAELREMLVSAERELAEVREEYSFQSAEIDKLRSELARERDVNRNLQIRYDDALHELREEHAEQTQRLLDQISVLKRLSENVMDEKAKLTEETAQRKQQLLALLERERDEKSNIMADYRQQTEALIAEQGREITSMRSTLQLSREEQERLQAERHELEEKVQTLEEQVSHLESTLAKERAESDKRLQEINQRHTRKIEELAVQSEEIATRADREAGKQQERRQELEDQLRTVGERLRVLEESHALEQQTLKESYRREVEGLREELQIVNAQREQLVEQHDKAKQKLLKNEEKITQSLRQSVEQLRQEKEAMTKEAALQQEEMQEKHWAKINQLQIVIEGLRRQVADESAARKDAESERDLLTARVDGLQGTVSRLAGELESLQVEHRTRERAAAAERESCVEELRAQVLERDGELAALRGELTQRGEAARRDLATASAELERVRTESRRTAEGERDRAGRELAAAAAELERLRAEIGQLHRDAAMREGAWQDELAEMRETHEEDLRRMDNVLHTLRIDLTRALAAKEERQKETAAAQREIQRQRAQLEDALSLAEDARTKLQDDAHYREQLNNELQGTVRLLASKLASHEDDARRLQEELTDVNTRLHDAHTLLGRKDAAIGQLNARLRAYEMSTLNRLKCLEKLGEGTYGVVYKARELSTGQIVAFKRMIINSEDEGVPATAIREVCLLRELKHDNIVSLRDVLFEPPKLTLVFEYCEYDLKKYMERNRNRPVPELMKDIQQILKQVLAGLRYMHKRNVVHRDLKPENIFLNVKNVPHETNRSTALVGVINTEQTTETVFSDALLKETTNGNEPNLSSRGTQLEHDNIHNNNGNEVIPKNNCANANRASEGNASSDPFYLVVKLGDYGLARVENIPVKKYSHDVVSLWYRSPDVMMGSALYGFTVDMWSVGCIFAELVAGKPLLSGRTDVDQVVMIFRLLGTPTPETWPSMMTYPKTSQVLGAAHELVRKQAAAAPEKQPPGRSQHQSQQRLTLSRRQKERQQGTSQGNTVSQSSSSCFHVVDEDSGRNLSSDKDAVQKNFYKFPPELYFQSSFSEYVRLSHFRDRAGDDGVDLLQKLVRYEPSHRLTAHEALCHPFLRHVMTPPRRPVDAIAAMLKQALEAHGLLGSSAKDE